MKNVFVPNSEAKYEGRTLLNKVVDNWEAAEKAISEKLETYQSLVGGPHLQVGVIAPLAAIVNSLREYCGCDEEDRRVGVGQYLYQLYCVRAVVKHLTEPHWRVVLSVLNEHFWYTMGVYRGSTAEAARRQLDTKLEFTSMGLGQFIATIE